MIIRKKPIFSIMIMQTEKNRKGKRWQSVIVSLFLAVLFSLIIAFLAFSNWKIIQKRTELNAKIKQLKEEIYILGEKNQQLKEQISQSLDQTHIEEVARERLSLKKPGEEVMVVLPPPEEQSAPPKDVEKGFLQKILEKLGF